MLDSDSMWTPLTRGNRDNDNISLVGDDVAGGSVRAEAFARVFPAHYFNYLIVT